MNFETEKDYTMRMIKEIVKVLASLALGKKYAQVALPQENKYGISGGKFAQLKTMVDHGEMNEAENMLLDQIDYANKESIAELIFFYEYTDQKSLAFLKQHNYSQEEVLDGLRMLAGNMGYQDVIDMLA